MRTGQGVLGPSKHRELKGEVGDHLNKGLPNARVQRDRVMFEFLAWKQNSTGLKLATFLFRLENRS